MSSDSSRRTPFKNATVITIGLAKSAVTITIGLIKSTATVAGDFIKDTATITIYLVVLILGAHPANAQLVDLLFVPADVTLEGIHTTDATGEAVAFGDFDGDGRSDMIIGAPNFDYMGRNNCGIIFVVFSSDSMGAGVDLDTLRGDIRPIIGPTGGSQIGRVLTCGDIDNDGRDDIVCGLPSSSPGGKSAAGQVLVIFGRAQPPDTLDLAGAPSRVTWIQGADILNMLGTSVAVGDIDNDNFGDIVVGAPFASTPAGSFSGKVYVIYGATTLDASIDLASTAAPLTQIFGQNSSDTFGTACHSADVNNDGIADVIAGAPEARPFGKASAGITYIVPGNAVRVDTVATATPGTAIKILGAAAGSLVGSCLTTGDWDKDLRVDLVIGAPEYSPAGRSEAGAVYVVSAPAVWPDTVDLAAPSVDVTRIDGPTANLNVGHTLSVTDIDADGAADLLIGAEKATPAAGRTAAGIVYIVFGRPLSGQNLDLAISQFGVTQILGDLAGENLGHSLAGADGNLDLLGDVLIGAPNAVVSGNPVVGRAYLIRGGPAITPTGILSGDPPGAGTMPPRAHLHPAFPNPFRSQTVVTFDTPTPGHAAISVYNVLGQHVATLVDRPIGAGEQFLTWNGRNRRGQPAPSGIYFIRMRFEGQALQRKIVLLR